LRELSPALFAAIPPPPMAIGIHDVIVERLGLDPEGQADLRAVIAGHVHRIAYQKALAAEGAVRLDIDGMPADEVTEEQRQIATKKLERLKAKAAAGKARDGK
jgi:sRNA-binding protein